MQYASPEVPHTVLKFGYDPALLFVLPLSAPWHIFFFSGSGSTFNFSAKEQLASNASLSSSTREQLLAFSVQLVLPASTLLSAL